MKIDLLSNLFTTFTEDVPMNTKNRFLLPALTGATIVTLGLTTATHAATVSVANATIIDNNAKTVNANSTGAVGRNDGGTLNFRAFMVFRVSDILTNESLTLSDLATTSFALTFDTDEEVLMDTTAGTYKADYIGFFANSNFPASGQSGGSNMGDWNGLFDVYNTAEEIDTGVVDTLLDQTGITASGFTLTGVTEADTANDVVVFGIRYDENQGAGENQTLNNYTLSVVPEPGSLALLGLGGLCVLRRRR